MKKKINKLKAAAKKDHEDLSKKVKDGLKKINKKQKQLKQDFQKTQKRKTVTFRVKKSG